MVSSGVEIDCRAGVAGKDVIGAAVYSSGIGEDCSDGVAAKESVVTFSLADVEATF